MLSKFVQFTDETHQIEKISATLYNYRYVRCFHNEPTDVFMKTAAIDSFKFKIAFTILCRQSVMQSIPLQQTSTMR